MSSCEERLDWKTVWQRKGRTAPKSLDLKQLLVMDGFDTGVGAFPVDAWLSYVGDTQSRLGLLQGHSALEVGCGVGAFLLPLYDSGITVYGIDYSEPHIQLCSKVMGAGSFRVADADMLPFDDDSFEAVLSHSVFQYFGDLAYAEKVIGEMARVLIKGGRGAVLDVNDLAKREAYEAARRQRAGDAYYDRLYAGLKHQFYSKTWFQDVAAKLGLSCEIGDQTVVGYDNASYRFNVFLEKG